jgi:4-amino-4-deoxy-L-arabinose transferase-like glycosyltransferase
MTGLRVLFVPAVLLLFLGLGANTIWDANEAFYVDTPRQMVQSGDYVTPVFNGEPRLNKPVLSYWVVAGLYHLFGTSIAVERFGIALGALGILLAAYLCGRAVRSPLAGWLAVLFVVTAPRFVMFSRRIFIDIWVTMFMALTMACFLLAQRHPQRRRWWLALMYVAMGLGVLTKGPVALVFPAAAIGIWLLVERRLGDLTRLWLVPGVLIVIAINLPWWWAVYAQHGIGPIQDFWLGENVGRYTQSMQPAERDMFFYVPVVIGDLFPWSLFVIAGLISGAAALWAQFQPAAGSEPGPVGEPPIRRFLLIWIAALVGVFSFSETKQDLYVYPIIPALAALAADGVIGGLDRGGARVRQMLLATAVLLVVAGAGINVLFGMSAQTHRIAGADGLSLALAAGGLLVAVLAWRHQARAAILGLAGAMVVANYIFVLVSLPAVEAYKPVVPMVQTIQARTRPDAPPPVVAHYITSLPSLTYYLNRPVEGYFDLPALMARAHEAPEMYILMRPHEYADFARAALTQSIPTCIVLRQTLFEAKLRLVLDGTPWPEVYLVGAGAACRS